jgi:hypothetical protein
MASDGGQAGSIFRNGGSGCEQREDGESEEMPAFHNRWNRRTGGFLGAA